MSILSEKYSVRSSDSEFMLCETLERARKWLGVGCSAIGDWDSLLARVLRKSLVSADMEIHFPVVLRSLTNYGRVLPHVLRDNVVACPVKRRKAMFQKYPRQWLPYRTALEYS